MKSLKTLFLGLSVLALAVSAQAQTVLRLTGSTAYRAQTHTAIQGILDPGYTFSYTGGSLSSAVAATFEGTVSGNAVIIQTGWTGSVEGIRDVSTSVNNQQNFVPAGGGSAGGANGATASQAGIPDVALSDAAQGSTVYTSPALVGNPSVVGIIPFRFFTNSDAPFDAVTDQQIQQLFAAGQLPLGFFTGNSADNAVSGGVPTRHVYAAGRANVSGTRLIMHQETGIGAFTSVNQYSLNGARDTLTFLGNAGVSGSALASYVSGVLTGTLANNYMLVYAGGGDAATAITNGAKELKYNGQLFAGSNAKVQEGTYTFWGYENYLYRSTLAGVQKTVADILANQIKTNDVVLTGMNVQRQTDGGTISSKLE